MEIDFPQQQATVTVLADQYDRDALMRALQQDGFGGRVVSEQEAGATGRAR
ncbi:MAG: hypothetical protein L0Z62_04985 [Gemmataceae bacterium]|nr:hypothetical protein [Gemmataceae bacterium]